MTAAENAIRAAFPNLNPDDFAVTSPRTPVYNCIAWAAGDDTSWWWPTPFAGPPLGGYYWPEGVPLVESVDAFVRTFRRHGYRECEDGELEHGYEKVALYTDADGTPTHAARQLSDGSWTSKLGKGHDISHGSSSAVEGDAYGTATIFLRRTYMPNRPGPDQMDKAFRGVTP